MWSYITHSQSVTVIGGQAPLEVRNYLHSLGLVRLETYGLQLLRSYLIELANYVKV